MTYFQKGMIAYVILLGVLAMALFALAGCDARYTLDDFMCISSARDDGRVVSHCGTYDSWQRTLEAARRPEPAQTGL